MEKKTSPSKKSTASQATNGKKKSNSTGQPIEDSMLADFFHDELKDIYWAEKHLVKTLPKMRKAAGTKALQDAIEEHLEVTKGHVSRLEQAFDLLGFPAQAKKCEAMEGITKEGDSIVEDTEDGTATRDVGIILAAQKVEHYEIATYGGLTQLAKTLGYDEVAALLSATLEEEKEADQSLTGIAENDVNYQAAVEMES